MTLPFNILLKSRYDTIVVLWHREAVNPFFCQMYEMPICSCHEWEISAVKIHHQFTGRVVIFNLSTVFSISCLYS